VILLEGSVESMWRTVSSVEAECSESWGRLVGGRLEEEKLYTE
jgi:hypothetical protein